MEAMRKEEYSGAEAFQEFPRRSIELEDRSHVRIRSATRAPAAPVNPPHVPIRANGDARCCSPCPPVGQLCPVLDYDWIGIGKAVPGWINNIAPVRLGV